MNWYVFHRQLLSWMKPSSEKMLEMFSTNALRKNIQHWKNRTGRWDKPSPFGGCLTDTQDNCCLNALISRCVTKQHKSTIKGWEDKHKELSEQIKTYQKSEKELQDSLEVKDHTIEVSIFSFCHYYYYSYYYYYWYITYFNIDWLIPHNWLWKSVIAGAVWTSGRLGHLWST